LGVAYADAVRDDGFTLQNDDTAFTGGYAAGIGISNRDGVNGDPYILRSNGSDGAQFSFDASQNEVNAVLSMLQGPRTATASSTPPGNGPSGADIGTVTYGFGSASTRSALISDRNFALRNRTTQDIGFIPGDTNIDGSTGRETAGVQQAFRGALISNDAAGDAANTIYGDTVADDDHQYLRWGWWSGEFRFSDEDTSDFAGRRERTHLGTWIAGNRLDQSIVMARQGAANFDGHAIVSIVDANGQSVNGGSFDLSYDFDEGFGEARFRGLAGYDFDIGVSTTGSLTDRSAPHYTGRETDLAGATGMPNIDVGVTGSFFGDRAADSVRATAGHIDIQSTDGTSLIGSGTFGGDIIDPNT
jgi:hypothetical protein